MDRKQMTPVIRIAFAIGSIALLTACAAAVQPEPDDGEPQPAEEKEPDDASEEMLVPPSGVVDLQNLTPVPGEQENVVQPAPGVPDPAAKVVQLARQELAEKVGRDISEIELVSVEAVDWPDSSLGCPQPGQLYLQVITPGYRILLEVDSERFQYHADSGSRVVHCP